MQNKSCDANQDAIWDYFQNDAVDSFKGSIARLDYLLRKIPPKSVILNVGVGSGYFEKMALEFGHDVYCLDPSARAIENLRGILCQKARVGYSQSMPFETGLFDVVIMSEVLEHLTNEVLTNTLSEVSRVLKSGGIFLGTVPADENLREQHVVCPDCGRQFHRWGHVQSFNMKRVQRLLEPGYDELFLQRRLFITWSVLNWKGKFLALTKRVLLMIGVHGSNENILFFAVKK